MYYILFKNTSNYHIEYLFLIMYGSVFNFYNFKVPSVAKSIFRSVIDRIRVELKIYGNTT